MSNGGLETETGKDTIEVWKNTPLPFELGKNSRIAVKIVNDRGIESLKVVEVK